MRTAVGPFLIEIPPNVATMATITNLIISADLSYADIYISAIDGVEAAVKLLVKRKGEIAKTLSKQLITHRTPQLRFHVDEKGQELNRLDEILKSL